MSTTARWAVTTDAVMTATSRGHTIQARRPERQRPPAPLALMLDKARKEHALVRRLLAQAKQTSQTSSSGAHRIKTGMGWVARRKRRPPWRGALAHSAASATAPKGRHASTRACRTGWLLLVPG